MIKIINYYNCSEQQRNEDGLCLCKYCNRPTPLSPTASCSTCTEIISHARYNLDAVLKIINELLREEVKMK